jgi:hypothetical protein
MAQDSQQPTPIDPQGIAPSTGGSLEMAYYLALSTASKIRKELGSAFKPRIVLSKADASAAPAEEEPKTPPASKPESKPKEPSPSPNKEPQDKEVDEDVNYQRTPLAKKYGIR